MKNLPPGATCGGWPVGEPVDPSPRYTAAELDLMANLVVSEMAARFADAVLHDQHDKAVRHAAETGRPVQGVCPTMFRNADRSRTDEDGIDCSGLANRLQQHAAEVRKSGAYR